MFATFSFEARLNKRLREWNMSADALSLLLALNGISGVGKTRLHGALTGRLPALPNEMAEQIEPLIHEIVALTNNVAPLKLDLTNAPQVYGWLQARRDGTLTIEVKQVNQS